VITSEGHEALTLAVAVGADNAFLGVAFSGVDGDTHHISVVDVLISTPVILAVRIAGINAPELAEPGGPEAKAALGELLPAGMVVTLRHVHPDKYAGRIVAQVITGLGVDVGPRLISMGLAVAWSGVGPKPPVPWPSPLPLPLP
jgi:endonuclease YncB( thermonuclease family)